MHITIPEAVRNILAQLNQYGFEAYAVGGSVRDSLMGLLPNDWDITTNALPDQVKSCFAEQQIIDTGLQHGTVTLIYDGKPYEITTYRTEGQYTDGRHPDSIRYAASLAEDLVRRDFTINAIAADAAGEIVDPLAGMRDLDARLIRCVGRPDERFGEDALRILRGLRFASQLAFAVDQGTAESIHRNKELLCNVSAERIARELTAMLCGKNIYNVMMNYGGVLAVVIPELTACMSFEQNTPYHCYDVYRHIAVSVAHVPPEPVLRWTMLLHDIGKPQCYSVDAAGNGHFYGHNKASSRIAENVLGRLRLPRRITDDIVTLVKYHDLPLQGTDKFVLRMLNKIGEEQFRRLLEVHRADAAAQSALGQSEQYELIARAEAALAEVLLRQQAFSLRDLAVSGRDIIALGVSPGKRVGELLDLALEAVMNGLPNEKTAVLHYLRELM